MVRKIGYDPGFDANKAAEVRDEEIHTYALPSAVGLANRSRRDGLSLAGVVKPQKSTGRPYRVAFEGVEYLVGPNVADFVQPIERMDFDRFTDSPELRATIYATLYHLINGGEHEIALAVALPVEVLQDADEAARLEKGMRSWLLGQYTFCVDGVATVVTITNLRAKIPQPIASWFEWGLDSTGQWIRGNDALRAPALIVDEGFNTMDVLVVENGKISHRYGGGDTLGMRRAAERLIETVAHYYGVYLELATASQLIREVVSGQRGQAYVRGRGVDVTQEAKQAFAALEADVLLFIDRSVGKAKETYQVLLTGGGVIALASRLLRRFPEAIVLPEPVLANARGLAKLACRSGFLD